MVVYMRWEERNGVHHGGWGVNDIDGGDNDSEQLFMCVYVCVMGVDG